MTIFKDPVPRSTTELPLHYEEHIDDDADPGLYDIVRRRVHRGDDDTVRRIAYREEIDSQNIYIIGGVGAGKTELAYNLNEALPHMHVVDAGGLFRVASVAVLEDTLTNPGVMDEALIREVEAGSAEATEKFVTLLSRKIKLLQKVFGTLELEKETGFTQQGQSIGEDTLRSGIIDSLVPHVAQAPRVRQLVWQWIDAYAKDKGKIILTGHDLSDVDTTDYTIIRLGVSPDVAAERVLARNPDAYDSVADAREAVDTRNLHDGHSQAAAELNYLGVERINTDDLTVEEVALAGLRSAVIAARERVDRRALQYETELPRESFEWAVNGIVAGIRTAGGPIYADIIAREQATNPGQAPTEFDLSIQTMIDLCSRNPSEIWLGHGALMTGIAGLIKEGQVSEANRLFDEGMQRGDIWLNEALVRESALGQVERLRQFSTARYEHNGDELRLPTYGRLNVTHFGHPEAELMTKGRKIETLVDGRRDVTVHEKHSGKTVTFKRVDSEISRAYAEGLHYLHAARNDEHEAFGAYIEGEELPIAWVSYSPVDRDYKKEMMMHLGVEPQHMLEMTRAWSADGTPKNTMSLLFAHAHGELQEAWRREVANGERNKPLAGVLTAINPNLGFKANAFNGVDFGVVGLKPASFTYHVGLDGKTTYMPRRAIARRLDIPESQLETHPGFMRSQVPLMPTNEMAVLFKGKERVQLSGPIYRIPGSNYETIR